MTKSFVFFGLIRNNFDKEYVCKLYKNNGNTERDKILSLDSSFGINLWPEYEKLSVVG